MKLSDLPDDVPEPSIKIDNHTDPYHTIVSISYGNRLGELLDTVRPCIHYQRQNLFVSDQLSHVSGQLMQCMHALASY